MNNNEELIWELAKDIYANSVMTNTKSVQQQARMHTVICLEAAKIFYKVKNEHINTK